MSPNPTRGALMAAEDPAIRALEQRIADLETNLDQLRLKVLPFLVDVAFRAGRDSLTNPQRFAVPQPERRPRHLTAVMAAEPEGSPR